MTKQEIRKVNAILTKVEAAKTKIATLRDLLRTEVSELESILEDLDTADAYFADGLRDLSDGLDKIS